LTARLCRRPEGQGKSFDEFWEDADMAVIDDAYRRAARIFSPDISRTYVEHLAQKVASVDDDPEEYLEAIVESRVTVAGLGLVMEVQAYFDAEADKLAKAWLTKYAPQMKSLTDDRKESYRQIIEMSSEPQSVDLAKPESRYEATKARDNNNEIVFPTWKNHLLCDKHGKYPAEMNDWERAVVEAESKRTGFSFWYRNPQQPGQSSLGIAYLNGEQYGILRPDFIFFATQADGTIVADIVDPHGVHLADALPKLQGLAAYANEHADAFRRIEVVAEASGKLRVLDLTRADVRQAVLGASSAKILFEGLLAADYV
jgi:type III restriction enzyme